MKEPFPYTVIVKAATMDKTESTIRLGKAFDGLFDEVVSRQHRKKRERTDAGEMPSKSVESGSSRALRAP